MILDETERNQSRFDVAMGASGVFFALLIAQLAIISIGEASDRRYRILSGRYPLYYYNPARHDENRVYVTDKHGRTTTIDDYRYRTAVSLSNPCASCGHNAQCSIIGGRPVCSCLNGHIGDPLSTCRRPECTVNSDCGDHRVCSDEKCVDPCAGTCGSNSHCLAKNHVAVCSCPAGYTGDPFTHCRRFDPAELCHPSPCGQNTNCEVVNEVPTCKCLPGYHGSPIAGCRHECESDSECGPQSACVEFTCQNPCQRQCGANAQCEGVRNHAAICKCPTGHVGNPYSSCRPECVAHSDCPRHKPQCVYNTCQDPCVGSCGIGANCELRGPTPICSCPRDMTGDPFVRCRPFTKSDLCNPNPCGVNAKCEPGYDRSNKERPVCICLTGYTGDPITGCVRAECTSDDYCPDNKACIEYKCENPCFGQCGTNAECSPRRHLAVCTCPVGYNGDALVNCHPVNDKYIRYY